jgi:hypothetical protein
VAEPLVQLEPGGKASLLRYDIPEPTSYPGRNFIELDLLFGDETPQDVFLAKAFEKPTKTRPPLRGIDLESTKTAVIAAMKSGFSDPTIFPNVRLTGAVLGLKERPEAAPTLVSSVPLTPQMKAIAPDSVALALQAGKRFNIYKTLFGSLSYCYIDEPTKAEPAIYLVESYRLSSFLGDYGAGRILETFSLLPGEKSTISIKTFRKTQTQSKEASSILDSFTEESAQEFERSVAEEQSDKQEYQKSFEYHAEAEASASWGWGSAKVSGGVKGSTNSAREEFTKNVSSATAKHSSRASAKRDVNINTSYEVTEETGEETSITREIENINLSRTLNFVFRQMNQEFFTLLHLVDVRVAFFNGFAESRREVSLPELDSLLDEYIVEEKQGRVRDAITDALGSIVDFSGSIQTDFLRKRKIGKEQEVTAVNREKTSTFTAGDREITVPGIIVDAKTAVMRTEGVVVEALLGQADALDEYAQQLQELEVDRREAEVARQKALAERDALLNKVVADGDAERAKLLEDLTCPCGHDGTAVHIDVEPSHDDSRSKPEPAPAEPSPPKP